MKMNGSPILEVNTSDVRCRATLELASKLQRPYLWRVTVMGDPPHRYTRVYEVQCWSENTAAMSSIDRFVREMQSPLLVIEPKPWY